MCQDHFPINARMTKCAIERNKMHGIVKISHEFDLLVNCQLFKVVKTGKKFEFTCRKHSVTEHYK